MTERSNEKALKILEQQYNSFIKEQESWEFFRGLAEYVKTVQELVQTRPIVRALELRREVARRAYGQINTGSLKELRKSAETIAKITQHIAKQYEPVAQALKEVQGYLNGTTLSSKPLYGLNNALFEVARHLRESGHADLMKQFEDNQRKVQNIYGNYTFSPTYEKLADEEKKFERREAVEPWGAWHHLPVVKTLVFEHEKITEELTEEAQKDPQAKWTLFNLMGVLGELEKIRLGELSGDTRVVFFKIKEFRSYAQRTHNYIIAELIKTDGERKLDFDPKTSILYFAGEEITISKRAENDAHELLRTIFKDRAKVWDKDEVLDDWMVSHTKSQIPKNKVYQAGKAVNRIVAQETTIKDFLEVSTKTVAINKKYLSS